LEIPRPEALETPKAIETFMLNPFSKKESKFKKVREWFPLLKAYFKTQAITLNNEKVRVAQSLL
jgi:hypothetical protein